MSEMTEVMVVGEVEANQAGDETASLLVRSSPLPEITAASEGLLRISKPVLMRQDCTTSRLSVSPKLKLSNCGAIVSGSEESTGRTNLGEL